MLPRHSEIWFPGYVSSRIRNWTRTRAKRAQRVWLAIADHYEPLWNRVDELTAANRVAHWRKLWPAIADRVPCDSAGHKPKYTFFYPEEEYRPALLDALAEMKQGGIADVEIHLHHDGEGRQNFVDRISGFKERLVERHGLLRERSGKTVFGFIHGNWALDNSRPDGRWCGLNDEILLLRDLGCYADFTMPSGNSPTQSKIVNRIYWCIDDPQKPKSYDWGLMVEPGSDASGDLLMIPGPLAIRWKDRVVPRLETGEIASSDLPTPYRVNRWLDVAPRLGNDIFIKLFTHGAQERNSGALLDNGALDRLFTMLSTQCQKREYQLYYASAWEMFLAVDAVRRNADPVTAAADSHAAAGVRSSAGVS
jgi:hypothetical protein